jgi:hypothetical protein
MSSSDRKACVARTERTQTSTNTSRSAGMAGRMFIASLAWCFAPLDDPNNHGRPRSPPKRWR